MKRYVTKQTAYSKWEVLAYTAGSPPSPEDSGIPVYKTGVYTPVCECDSYVNAAKIADSLNFAESHANQHKGGYTSEIPKEVAGYIGEQREWVGEPVRSPHVRQLLSTVEVCGHPMIESETGGFATRALFIQLIGRGKRNLCPKCGCNLDVEQCFCDLECPGCAKRDCVCHGKLEGDV